ncbi:ArsC/Spx/MgsR family protein [Lactococcus garvieae]|uniref:ArsC/Spx/MgsR family protein n=1 Tax=Lactococcus garvieae TaxID=1363 RepID=UPI000308A693|nr:ArsC/Spx/MgsR family protein [Lactococcus garvieae]
MGGCTSCIKAKQWFEAHGLEFEQRRITELSQDDFFHLLSLTESGVEEVVKLKGKWNKSNLQSLFHFNDWTLRECVHFLKYHPEFLQAPIVLADNKYMIGYNPDDIRQFLPKSYRELARGTKVPLI